MSNPKPRPEDWVGPIVHDDRERGVWQLALLAVICTGLPLIVWLLVNWR